MFSRGYCEIFKNTYFEEHLRTTAFTCSQCVYTFVVASLSIRIVNRLMPGGNKKVTHTEANLQLSAAGLFKYV